MKLKPQNFLFWRHYNRTLHCSNVKYLLTDVEIILQVTPQWKYSIKKSQGLSKPS